MVFGWVAICCPGYRKPSRGCLVLCFGPYLDLARPPTTPLAWLAGNVVGQGGGHFRGARLALELALPPGGDFPYARACPHRRSKVRAHPRQRYRQRMLRWEGNNSPRLAPIPAKGPRPKLDLIGGPGGEGWGREDDDCLKHVPVPPEVQGPRLSSLEVLSRHLPIDEHQARWLLEGERFIRIF